MSKQVRSTVNIQFTFISQRVIQTLNKKFKQECLIPTRYLNTLLVKSWKPWVQDALGDCNTLKVTIDDDYSQISIQLILLALTMWLKSLRVTILDHLSLCKSYCSQTTEWLYCHKHFDNFSITRGKLLQ